MLLTESTNLHLRSCTPSLKEPSIPKRLRTYTCNRAHLHTYSPAHRQTLTHVATHRYASKPTHLHDGTSAHRHNTIQAQPDRRPSKCQSMDTRKDSKAPLKARGLSRRLLRSHRRAAGPWRKWKAQSPRYFPGTDQTWRCHRGPSRTGGKAVGCCGSAAHPSPCPCTTYVS